MDTIENFKKLSFLVYGLGQTGRSVVDFFKKNNFKNYQVWDDKNKNLLKTKRSFNLKKAINKVHFIVLSPGISIKKSKNKKILEKNKKKIITDIDLIFLLKKYSKCLVITGTNGKSTTCKIINHVLKKNGFKTLLGGNIGTPALDLNIKKRDFLIIEASSFQLAHSKFIKPDYAMLLNITNDHLDWHGNMKNYIDSKFRIFKHQKKNQYSFVNAKWKREFKKRNLLGKLVIPNIRIFQKHKSNVKNSYLESEMNNENMSFVFELAMILKISKNSFFKSLNSFKGLPHRYEIFLKRKNCLFINDSKATSFQATKLALKNSNNIYWIVGGLPKKNDEIDLKDLKKHIVKSYIVGKNIGFFKRVLQNQVSCFIAKNLKNSIIQIFKDIKMFKKNHNTILLSPASASYDQFINFEKRGEKFKKLIKYYVGKYL